MSIYTTSKDVTISFEEYDNLHIRIASLQRDNQEFVKVINQQQKLIENLQYQTEELTNKTEMFQQIELQYARRIRELSKQALAVAKNLVNTEEESKEYKSTIEQLKSKIQQKQTQDSQIQQDKQKSQTPENNPSYSKIKKDLASLQTKYSLAKTKLKQAQTLDAKHRSQIKILNDENINLLDRYEKLLEEYNGLLKKQQEEN